MIPVIAVWAVVVTLATSATVFTQQSHLHCDGGAPTVTVGAGAAPDAAPLSIVGPHAIPGPLVTVDPPELAGPAGIAGPLGAPGETGPVGLG